MKNLIPFATLVCCTFALWANAEGTTDSITHNPASPAKTQNDGTVRVQLANINPTQHADSILIIFDRFDRTGAGVIYRVFNADQKNRIDIQAIPAGKYYVTIQCLGLHHDRIQKTIKVRKNKEEEIKVSLSRVEIFNKDQVVIPADNYDLAKLSIFRPNYRRN